MGLGVAADEYEREYVKEVVRQLWELKVARVLYTMYVPVLSCRCYSLLICFHRCSTCQCVVLPFLSFHVATSLLVPCDKLSAD